MIRLPTTAQHIIDTMHKKGFQCYAVGGSVRDTLLGKGTKGWDFTTNATPEQVLGIFPDSFYDNQFGTVGVKIYSTGKDTSVKPDDIYEITTYRSEKEYSDFRHPDKITWGVTLAEDLSRRDFTINAIATDGKEIFDPHGGQKDLQDKIIRTVGNPEDRFQEDALRMMRAIRIASELGFLIDPTSAQAIRKHATLLSNVSPERIQAELIKIMASDYPSDGILLAKNTQILSVILPELDRAFEVKQKSPKRHHIYDVGTHSVMALKHCPSKDPIVRLATLLHDIGKVPTFREDTTGLVTFYNHEIISTKLVKGIMQRLRMSKNDSERILTLVRWHQFTVDERQTDSAIRRIIRHVGKENLEDMLALRTGDRLGGGALETSWRMELFKKRLVEVQKQPFTVADLHIDGYDVMKILHLKPGPKVGETLNALFSQVEKGTIPNERDALLRELEKAVKPISK